MERIIKSFSGIMYSASCGNLLTSKSYESYKFYQSYRSCIKRRKQKTGGMYFSNVNYCLKITQHKAFIVTEKPIDHEEADTKLVALVEVANIANGKTVMIGSSFEDIDIIVLLILLEFKGSYSFN